MKKDTWGRNVISLILIIALFCVRTVLLSNYFAKVQETYAPNWTLVTLINLLCLGGIGFVLGLDNNTARFKKDKKLRFNIPKLIILALPSLIFSISNILAKFATSAELIDSIIIVSSIVYGHAFASSMFEE